MTQTQTPHRALCIPELLEQILLQLPMRTLLAPAQRVCQDWNQLIKTSPAIQKMLYFKASKRGTPSIPNSLVNAELCHRHLMGYFTKIDQTIILNAFRKVNATAEAGCAYRRDIFHRPEASWRKMLFHQPPKRVEDEFSDEDSETDFALSGDVALKSKGDSARLGDVVGSDVLCGMFLRECACCRDTIWDISPPSW